MATLKSLVDETTNIKNELKACHSNLASALTEKEIEVNSEDKLKNLIDKVCTIEPKIELPAWWGGWINLTSNMAIARQELTVDAIGTKIYCVGGRPNSTTSPYIKNECFDTLTGTFTDKVNAPTRRYGAVSGVIGNKLYITGGSVTGTTECYDPVSNSWTTKAKSTVGTNCCASVSNGKLYVFGGYVKSNRCYDPVSNTWTNKSDVPVATVYSSASSVGGKIYLVGGQDVTNGTVNTKTYIYNTVSNSWETKSNPSSLSAGCANAIGTKIYCISSNKVEVYDTINDKWQENLINMNLSRSSYGTTVANKHIYVIGGYSTEYVNGDYVTGKGECYIPR